MAGPRPWSLWVAFAAAAVNAFMLLAVGALLASLDESSCTVPALCDMTIGIAKAASLQLLGFGLLQAGLAVGIAFASRIAAIGQAAFALVLLALFVSGGADFGDDAWFSALLALLPVAFLLLAPSRRALGLLAPAGGAQQGERGSQQG